MKKCETCNELIIGGRSDKRFCNRSCKNRNPIKLVRQNVVRSKRRDCDRDYSKRDRRSLLLDGAKKRAKRDGRDFSLVKEDIIIPEVCPVLGTKLLDPRNNLGGKHKMENGASIDRVDNSKGYTPDNIIIVSRKVNNIKGAATVEELRRTYEYYKELESMRL